MFTLKPAWRNRAAIVPQLPKLAVLGFLAMALFQSLSYEAAKTTTATNMSIITALVPLMTMVASTMLLGVKAAVVQGVQHSEDLLTGWRRPRQPQVARADGAGFAPAPFG